MQSPNLYICLDKLFWPGYSSHFFCCTIYVTVFLLKSYLKMRDSHNLHLWLTYSFKLCFLIELKDNSPAISQSMEEDDLQQGEKQFGWDFVFTDRVKMNLLA